MASFKQLEKTVLHYISLSKNPTEGLAAFIMHSGNVRAARLAIRSLCSKNSYISNAIVGIARPKAVSCLGNSGNMPFFENPKCALLWSSLSFTLNGSLINSFLHTRSEYSHNYLLGNFETCLNILDKCQQSYGHSFWEIQNRISLLSRINGIECQKDYTKSLLSQWDECAPQAYIVNAYSTQCEKNISVNTYLHTLEANYNNFLSHSLPSFLCNYVRFRANGYFFDTSHCFSPEDISFFLFFEDKNSLIDRYVVFCDICVTVFAGEDTSLKELFVDFIQDILQYIDDPLLSNILYYYQNNCYPFHRSQSSEICDAYDLFIKASYNDCASKVSQLVKDGEMFFPLIELYAKCYSSSSSVPSLSSSTSPIYDIVCKLSTLYSRKGDLSEARSDLEKIALINANSTWAHILLTIVEKMDTFRVLPNTASRPNYYISVSLPNCIFDLSPAFLPYFLSTAPSEFTNCTATKLSVALKTHDLSSAASPDINPTLLKILEACILSETSPLSALSTIRSINTKVLSPRAQADIITLHIFACLNANLYAEALSKFVTCYNENNNYIHSELADIIFSKLKSGDPTVKGNILTPVLCSIYFNNTQRKDKDDVILTFCYDEYLESLGVSKPSEFLAKLPENVPDEYITMFLSDVCTLNVMDHSLALSSYDEVLQERITVCEKLIQRDPEHQSKYTDEMRRLTTLFLVHNAKRKVESGKIFIDTESIRGLITKEISESYKRYVEFRDNAIKEYVIQILNVAKSPFLPNNIVYTTSAPCSRQYTSMFIDIVKKIRDIFVADNKYGLDGCLSVRIRHGTLESQLRSCFERHKLITSKSIDGTYKKNESWDFANMPGKYSHEIDETFSHFSERVDTLILRLKKDYIQIQTEDRNPHGWFNFVVDGNLSSRIESMNADDTSFDTFEANILDTLLSITEDSLDLVRENLNKEIDGEFQDALKDLEAGIKKYCKNNPICSKLLGQIAQARTDISVELKNIAEWFRLTQPSCFSDYSLQLAIKTAIEIINYSSPACRLNLDYSHVDEQITMCAESLPHIVDIFKILFDNIIKHSGFSTTVCASMSAHVNDGILIIKVTNPVQPGYLDENRIRTVMEQLNNWESTGTTNREGGSGLPKIMKIISVGLHKQKKQVVINCSNNTFTATMELPVDGIIKCQL